MGGTCRLGLGRKWGLREDEAARDRQEGHAPWIQGDLCKVRPRIPRAVTEKLCLKINKQKGWGNSSSKAHQRPLVSKE